MINFCLHIFCKKILSNLVVFLFLLVFKKYVYIVFIHFISVLVHQVKQTKSKKATS